MGRTPKPLSLLVHPALLDDTFEGLAAQGHTVDPLDTPTLPLADYDMILSPNCWQMSDETVKYLPAALRRGRDLRYGVKT